MTPYHEALQTCGERYRDILSYPHPDTNDPLWQFTMEFLAGCRAGMPLCKLNRWLGYIQGVLIERKYTTVQAERDWTRPLFRPLDYQEGIA